MRTTSIIIIIVLIFTIKANDLEGKLNKLEQDVISNYKELSEKIKDSRVYVSSAYDKIKFDNLNLSISKIY
jgi:hypothetical protein